MKVPLQLNVTVNMLHCDIKYLLMRLWLRGIIKLTCNVNVCYYNVAYAYLCILFFFLFMSILQYKYLTNWVKMSFSMLVSHYCYNKMGGLFFEFVLFVGLKIFTLKMQSFKFIVLKIFKNKFNFFFVFVWKNKLFVKYSYVWKLLSYGFGLIIMNISYFYITNNNLSCLK